MIEAKMKTWVLCCVPGPGSSASAEVYYWGGKGHGCWEDDLSQATHFANKGAARAKMTVIGKKYKEKCPWYAFSKDDRMFIGEIDATVQINEVEGDGR